MRRFALISTAVVMTALLSGCASWKRSPQPGPVLDQLKTQPQAIRATLSDGTVITYRSPVVRGDSLLEGDRIHGTGRTVAVSHIRDIETKDVHEGDSLLFLIGGLFAVAVLAFLLAGPTGYQ